MDDRDNVKEGVEISNSDLLRTDHTLFSILL